MVFSGTFNNIMTLNSLPFMDRQYILARCILTVVYIIIALRLAPCCKEQLCISLGFKFAASSGIDKSVRLVEPHVQGCAIAHLKFG